MKTIDINTLILGAGISGLTAAFYHKRSGVDSAVIEKSSRVGGAIKTEQLDGFTLELGPNTVMMNAELYQLIQDLNLGTDMVIAPSKTPRFIYNHNSLHSVPMSFSSFFFSGLLSPMAKLRLLIEPFIAPSNQLEDISLDQFIRHRLGNQPADNLLAPFISGVWAGSPLELSAQSTFPKLVQLEKEHESLFKGALKSKREKSKMTYPKGLVSFNRGLETLTKALHENLKENIFLNQEIQSIEKEGTAWRVTTQDSVFKAEKLIATIPAFALAPLLKPLHPEAANALLDIPYASICVLHLKAETRDLGFPLNGFGFLTTPKENPDILGCLWSSSLFKNRSPKGENLLTVFMGGRRNPHIIDTPSDELFKTASRAVKQILSLKSYPTLIKLTKYKQAIPQYTIGHQHRKMSLSKSEESLGGLRIEGNYLAGISVGDVVKNIKTVLFLDQF